jgi:hypothetical protein
MAPRIDEALRPGGLYYDASGTAHDAEGRPLEGAPDRPENTPPDQQPFNRMIAATTIGAGFAGAPAGIGGAGGLDVEALGAAIGRGLASAANAATANAEAGKRAVDQHNEVRSAAEGAKVDTSRPAIVPASATADLNVGITGSGEQADRDRQRIADRSEAANATATAADAARRATTAAVTGTGTPTGPASGSSSSGAPGTGASSPTASGSTGGSSAPEVDRK